MDIMLKNILNLIDSNYQKDEDFENEFGISRSTVSAWRRGKLMSYQKYATKIASFFNVSADWISGNEQKNKPTVSKDDELIREQMQKVRLLPKEVQKQVLDYIDFVIEHQDK